MRKLQYRIFSRQAHLAAMKAQAPRSCQFELTFGCGLRCRHCYSDCYNKPELIGKELGTKQVKLVLNKIRRLGVLWLCFTGGDPLSRKDFCEIYSYARSKGFLLSVFTSGYSLNERILRLFRNQPPFVVEMTLNAADKRTYERISRVRGSFIRAIEAIRALKRANIPVKIKTMITKDNVKQANRIKRFLEKNGHEYDPDCHIFARLNGDNFPCTLRIIPSQVLSLKGEEALDPGDCRVLQGRDRSERLFWCALGSGQEFHLDPYGNMFLCPFIRDTPVNIVKKPAARALNKMIRQVRERVWQGVSHCRTCSMRQWCLNCPGKAYSQTRDMESALQYYCALTRQLMKK